MKTFVSLLLLCAFTGCAQDTTTKVSERRNPDGTLRHRIETTSRGETPILRVYTRPSGQEGKLTTSRSYMLGGKLVMVEVDEDGDGFFETTAVYLPSGGEREMEVFTRERDGSVRPVSERALAAYKKQHAAVTEFWDKARDDSDFERMLERSRELQQKIQDAEKEKQDEKK